MRICIILSTLVVLTSCMRQEFIIDKKGAQVHRTVNVKETQDFFVNGVGQTKVIRSDERCGGHNEVVKIAYEQKPLDIVLSSFTYGVYSPRSVEVNCK